jgi:hypothetical protein
MSASLSPSASRYLTRHDLAVLADIGWKVDLPTIVKGDYNDNGVVDAADYVVWRKNVGTTNDLRNDTTGTSTIGAAQYNLWRANFGKPLSAVSKVMHIPEPRSGLLAIMALSWVAASWRRFGQRFA